MKRNSAIKINLGCGAITPVDWLNIDASITARLEKHDLLTKILKSLGLIDKNKKRWSKNVFFHDLRQPLPFKDNSSEIIYFSHVLEHLYLDEAQKLLNECLRVLKTKGIIRIVVPDLEVLVQQYLLEKKKKEILAADHLNESLILRAKTKSTGNWFYRQYNKSTDFHSHKWMYDAESLAFYLKKAGFSKIKSKLFGKSLIKDIKILERPGRERKPSVYLEAVKM